MARLRFPSGEERDIPDEFVMTERGVEWNDDAGHHVVPWPAVLEVTGPPPELRPG